MPDNPNRKIRTANSVALLERRLTDFERADPQDPLEAFGIHDELQRLERKWIEQIAAGSDRRQADDPARIDGWYHRLQRQLERLNRSKAPDAAMRRLIKMSLDKVVLRRRMSH